MRDVGLMEGGRKQRRRGECNRRPALALCSQSVQRDGGANSSRGMSCVCVRGCVRPDPCVDVSIRVFVLLGTELRAR